MYPGRHTLFWRPLSKMVMNSDFRRALAAFSAAVRLRFVF